MTTTNKSKKQLVLVLMSGFFASALVGCNGDSSGSNTTQPDSNTQPTKTLAIMPDYPLRYSLVKTTKEDTIAKKKKRKNNKLQSAKNVKSLQMLGDTVDDVTNATNFLNIYAVAVPELGFITAPATLIEGIYSSDGLNTELSDITQAIQSIDSDLQQIQNQLNFQQSEIANSVIFTATKTQIIAITQYSTEADAISGLWSGFTGGIQGSVYGPSWYPNPVSGQASATYPDANQFNLSVGAQSLALSSALNYTLGFTTKPADGSVILGNGTGLQSILSAELSLFKVTEFQQTYGQAIGHNVANDIPVYNQKISNYYYNGLAIIQQLYTMQKEANILTYQTGKTYNGPLASIAPLNFDFLSNATESQNTTDFNTAQENLDNWATGAANQLFSVITPYIISDTPFTNPGNRGNELYYPYGASISEQEQWMGINPSNWQPIPGAGIVPNMVKTQSLVNPVISSGMPQITNSNTTNPSQFIFYVESGLGNPNQYIQAYQNAWTSAGGAITFTQSQIHSVFAYDANGDVPNYIAIPGYYDGQTLQMWSQDWWGNQLQTAATNLSQRCANNGSSITSFNDGNQWSAPHTFGWSCPTDPNPVYVDNNVAGTTSFQRPGNYEWVGLMSPQTESIITAVGASSLGPITVSGFNTIVNDFNQWIGTPNPAIFNTVMSVNGYQFNPSFAFYQTTNEYWVSGHMYCGPNDPLCTIDPVTNQICLAGQVVGLNWINGDTAMFGAYVPGTTNQQHCYNS